MMGTSSRQRPDRKHSGQQAVFKSSNFSADQCGSQRDKRGDGWSERVAVFPWNETSDPDTGGLFHANAQVLRVGNQEKRLESLAGQQGVPNGLPLSLAQLLWCFTYTSQFLSLCRCFTAGNIRFCHRARLLMSLNLLSLASFNSACSCAPVQGFSSLWTSTRRRSSSWAVHGLVGADIFCMIVTIGESHVFRA